MEEHSTLRAYVASWENAAVIYSDTRNILSYLITWSFINYFILTGSPSVTSLTYNNQSRTLTCTSTGGPATTVTWRRNGVVITHNAHQQTKSLVDRIKSTYRTVLTIGSSVLAGNYSCTVGLSSKSVVVTGTNWTLYSTPPCFGLLVLACMHLPYPPTASLLVTPCAVWFLHSAAHQFGPCWVICGHLFKQSQDWLLSGSSSHWVHSWQRNVHSKK